MSDAFVDTIEFFPRGLVFVGVGIVVILLAKLFQDLLTPYRINRQLGEKDNVALGLSITGYYLGVIIVFLGVLYDPLTVEEEAKLDFDSDFALEVLQVFLYSLAGILVLNVSRYLVDKLVLYKFDTRDQIIDDKNVGTGAVEFGVYVAVGLVIAASIAGTTEGGLGITDVSVGDSVIRSVAFFGLGMVVLILFALSYEFTTSFDVHDEIEDNNTAVGVALAGNLIAIGVVTFKAVFGEFTTWTESLVGFAVFAVIGFVLLYAIRFIVDIVLIPGTKVSHELAVDRNLGVAFIESVVVISAALILLFAI